MAWAWLHLAWASQISSLSPGQKARARPGQAMASTEIAEGCYSKLYKTYTCHITSHTHLRDKKMKLWLAWPGLAWEISGQKPKPAQARGVAWPGLTNPGLAWPGFWLEARPSTSLFLGRWAGLQVKML
ncbi:hypothetical protein DFH07DRAFT_766261 [Mycena maculata]|uniref:Uncharacterized protein n=1 Tax=Mycena maculata TaxID=230809 RepID=A0AAD7K472_9AGAR|nr:hypothetical protein DFH07DRAFT_766261 [Mycena maculata]